MKLVLLAAAAAIAMPAIAQQQTTSGNSPSTNDSGAGVVTGAGNNATGSSQTSPSQTPSGDMSGQTGATGQSMPMPAPVTTGDPVGGYQPSTPAMSGPMQPGATVTYQQAPSPDQAYPAPAPMAKYPICKKGQYDKCMQRGGR